MEGVLESLGLSKNESRVYLTLLEIGPSTAVRIATKSKVHRTNTYETLDRLTEKGLATFIIRDKKKVFEAAEPKALMTQLKEKESHLQEILPQLSIKHEHSRDKTKAHVHKSVSSIKTILNGFLEKRQPMLVYGVPKEAPEILGPWLAPHHKKRMAKKIRMEHIYNEDAIDRINELNKMSFTEARSLPKEFDSPVSTEICGDEVAIIYWDKKKPLIIHIQDEKIAESYKRYFKLLWGVAKKYAP